MNIIRRFEWVAAHRLTQHRGKCRNLHGHQYAIELTVSGDVCADGMVVDFGILDETFGAFIKNELDHSTMIKRDDPLGIEALLVAAGLRCHVVDFETSAENLAAYLLGVARAMLADRPITIASARVWETARGSAVAT